MKYRTINSAIKNIRNEEGKRYSLPQVRLTKIEKDVLTAIAEGRNIEEIDFALRMNEKYNSFYNIVYGILEKFEAFTIPHALTKAIALGKISTKYLSQH